MLPLCSQWLLVIVLHDVDFLVSSRDLGHALITPCAGGQTSRPDVVIRLLFSLSIGWLSCEIGRVFWMQACGVADTML